MEPMIIDDFVVPWHAGPDDGTHDAFISPGVSNQTPSQAKDYSPWAQPPYVNPVTGEVFEALDVPSLTRPARASLRRRVLGLFKAPDGLYAGKWIPYMNKVDRSRIARTLTQDLKVAAWGREEKFGEIGEKAVFEELEFFLPKAFMRSNLSGLARRSPGSIRFDPFTHRFMVKWRFQSELAPMRLLVEYACERERMVRAVRLKQALGSSDHHDAEGEVEIEARERRGVRAYE